jgi:outer membrane lipoprotein LolB
MIFAGVRLSLNTIFLLLLVVILPACTQMPVKRSPEDTLKAWQQHSQSVQGIDHWVLKARIGIIADGESGSAGLHWEQHGDQYTLRIIGPFGRGNLLIEGSPQGVMLQNTDGEMAIADNPEELIWQQTGWVIPVSDLRYWILGLPSQRHQRDEYLLDVWGRIENLNTDEWNVEYQAYKKTAGYELPDKLSLRNSHLRIKLAISEWRLL